MKNMQGKTDVNFQLLHDEKCEEAVLTAVLTESPRAIMEVREIIDDECFFNPDNSEIYKASCCLMDRGVIPDLLTVTAELHARGSDVSIVDVVAKLATLYTPPNTEYYAARLRDLEWRRRMLQIGRSLSEGGSQEVDDVLEVQQQAIQELQALFTDSRLESTTLQQSVEELKQLISQNISRDKPLLGTPSGFAKIDEHGGLVPSDLIIIAGESSHGKTSFALAMVLRAMQEKHGVAIYSLEMSRLQLTARLTAMLSGISSFRLLQERLLPINVETVNVVTENIHGNYVFFDDRPTSSLDTIITSARTMKLRYDIKGIVVDYLQILNVNQSNKMSPEQAMAQAARRLKNLAKELDIWVVALSQLNRDKDNPVPTVNRLRDSGQIVEAADVVILVYRPEVSERTQYPQPYADYSVKDTALIKVAKGRNTGPYSFICRFDAEKTLFVDYPNPTIAGRGQNNEKNEQEKLPF